MIFFSHQNNVAFIHFLFLFFSLISFLKASTCYQFLSKIHLLDRIFLFFLHFILFILFLFFCNILLMFLNNIFLVFLIYVSCNLLHNKSFSIDYHVSNIMSHFYFRIVLMILILF